MYKLDFDFRLHSYPSGAQVDRTLYPERSQRETNQEGVAWPKSEGVCHGRTKTDKFTIIQKSWPQHWTGDLVEVSRLESQKSLNWVTHKLLLSKVGSLNAAQSVTR